jgi:hypothetical protein
MESVEYVEVKKLRRKSSIILLLHSQLENL